MTWIQTHSGHRFDFLNPDNVCIEDVAHALSHLCRFAGHTSEFYSVAEHSALVSLIVPREFALQGLLHDAAEAYVIDLPKPLKDMLPAYSEIETKVWQQVARTFDIPEQLDESVKQADLAMLMAERERFFGRPPEKWVSEEVKPADVRPMGLLPSAAKNLFLFRFKQLTRGV